MSSLDPSREEPSEPSEPGPAGGAGSAAPGVADLVLETQTISARPLAEHAEVYQRVHAGLQHALAEIDGH